MPSEEFLTQHSNATLWIHVLVTLLLTEIQWFLWKFIIITIINISSTIGNQHSSKVGLLLGGWIQSHSQSVTPL